MKKHNIVFIVQGGKGGTLEYTKLFLNNIDKSKFKITTICHGEFYEELLNLGYNVHYVEMCREISAKNDFKSLLQIIKYLRKNRVDLVYSHSSKAGVLGRLAATICRIPNIYNPHGWSFSMKVNEKKKFFFALIEKVMSLITNKIVLISKSEYDNALKRKIANFNKCIIINNGINIDKFIINNNQIKLKQELNIKNDNKVIVMIGRLTKQKNPEMFINIADKFKTIYPECTFILVGDGEFKEDIVKKINTLKLDNVIVTGWVNNVEDYINISDVGVLTSQWEGFGFALAEYMACRKPIVASNVDGIPNVVRNNIDGFLCDSNNVNEFVDKIHLLLTDEKLYNKMSDSAYERVCSEFNSKQMVKKHEILFDKLLKRRKK